ncbi:hypothetical protein TTHERM_00412150 (macronuclear) [Tetrahymena thermophila SB210]|uniref:Uncharacterized protein n=1 Tax=Tetrahymena thermophila (strain SB210) TaxID=312017 RepID=I7M2L1_TETTS|nr:hypothetical protein TTHERM_00412150 [Tetrahymena thermophila SB210]EAS00664.4 hypothetical protein TTHERM_00412150 [Tetrahymena thermophila SB210]|eukprot:XP_001020909.4 hypothetical protein TTHERM_00412150 [Tetrahymena thermophila SB210]
MNFSQNQQRQDYRNNLINGNRLVNYNQNLQQIGVQQYQNYYPNINDMQQYQVQQNNSLRFQPQVINNMQQISQHRFYEQDGNNQLDRYQYKQNLNRMIEIEDMSQQQDRLAQGNNFLNRGKQINSVQQADRNQNNFNSNKFQESDLIRNSNKANLLSRFSSKDQINQRDRIQLKPNYIELEDEDEDDDEIDDSNGDLDDIQEVSQNYYYNQNNEDIEDDDDLSDDRKQDIQNQYNNRNYVQNLKGQFYDVRPQKPSSYNNYQHNQAPKQNIIQENHHQKINNLNKVFEYQRLGLSNNNNFNNEIKNANNPTSRQNQKQNQPKSEAQENNKGLFKQHQINDTVKNDQQSHNQEPVRRQAQEEMNNKYPSFDSEATSEEDFITRCERIKLQAEKQEDRFENIYEYLEKERKEFIKEGQMIKYYRNKERLRKITSNDYTKTCSYEDEKKLKGIEKTYSYKKHLHDDLMNKENKEKYCFQLSMKAFINFIGDIRKYEEDGNQYDQKTEILLEYQQKQKKLRSPPKNYLHKEQPIYKKRITDESIILLSQEENPVAQSDKKVQKNQIYSNNEDKEDEYDKESAQNEEEILKLKKSIKSKQQKVKLPCYCQEDKKDEVRLCYNKKCTRQWFHLKCLEKREQLKKIEQNQNNSQEIETALPKTDDEWCCEDCRQDESLIQKRSSKHRKYLQKQRNMAFKNNGQLVNENQKQSKKSSNKKGNASSLTMLNSTLFGSENSISMIKGENSNNLISSNSFKKNLESAQKVIGSAQKSDFSNDKKLSPIMQQKSQNQSPESQKKDNSDQKLQRILNKYAPEQSDLNKSDHILSQQQQVEQISSKSPQQKIKETFDNQQKISPQSQKLENKSGEEQKNINNKISPNNSKRDIEIEQKKVDDIDLEQDLQFYSTNKNQEEKIQIEQQNSQIFTPIKQFNLESSHIDCLNQKTDKSNQDSIKFHQNLIFSCQVDLEKYKKNKRSKAEVNLIALIKNNPFEIEIFNFDKNLTDSRKLQSVYYKANSPETSYYFAEHIIFKKSSYLIFSHEQTMSIFSVQEKNMWKMPQQFSQSQAFYLSSNENCIQIYTQGNQKNELKCINISFFDKTISITEEKFDLDEMFQNFQQLSFYKDQNQQICFMFLSQDRQTIYLCPDLDKDSDKPVISIENDIPLLQMHVVDPFDQKQVFMDNQKRILIYEKNGYKFCENQSVYSCSNKHQCIKYYVQSQKNILLQLYEEQIHLQYLDDVYSSPKVLSFSKPFIDAIYQEDDTSIIIFFIEKCAKVKDQVISYFIVEK